MRGREGEVRLPTGAGSAGPETTSSGSFDLKEYMSAERVRVEQALGAALARVRPRVPNGLWGAVEHGVSTGGKRLRPILCVAGYRALGGADAGIYALAVSLELIHAYSLMHDDLPCMDDAELRRGDPTTHKLHGERATSAAGALLIPAAALHVWEAAREMGLTEEVSRALVGELTRAAGAGGMVGGQALDLLGEDRTLSAAELDDLHRRKTGALLRASLRMGGIAGGASPAALAALDRYGAGIGLAFQVADDLLDATSTAEALGKNPSDAHLGKSTYVTLFGPEEALRRARLLVDQAVVALREGGLSSAPLEALARYIVERDR